MMVSVDLMNVAVIAAVLAVLAAAAAVIIYVRASRTMTRIDKMMDDAISGEFSESDFSEARLSRLETKVHRYLTKGSTAQKQIEAERMAIKKTVSDISHQTKTPIANMLLYTELLRERLEPDDENRTLVSQIEEQADKLSFLISSLVKTSRLESGIISPVPSMGSVNELLEELEAAFAGQAKEDGIVLVLDRSSCKVNGVCDDESFTAVGQQNDLTIKQQNELTIKQQNDLTAVFDRKWTMEALSNIVDNALKYTGRGGHVSISAEAYQLFVRIDIADDGIGISEDESSRIFGRFYRSPQVADKPGVGIGLYLAREIITREGGYIKLESAPGKGSRFSVFLPAE